VPSTPQQVVRRERVEGLIALAAPLLDLLLSAGERVSRAIGPDDEYYPIRSGAEAFYLPGSGPEPGEGEEREAPAPADSPLDA
jgi:hypothetical protein